MKRASKLPYRIARRSIAAVRWSLLGRAVFSTSSSTQTDERRAHRNPTAHRDCQARLP